MLKLITKLPEEKDPVIAVCFEKEWEARKLNEHIINNPEGNYEIKLMPSENGINLMLIGEKHEVIYKNLNYDYFKLDWWLGYAKTKNRIKFCHVIEEFGKARVVRGFEKNKLFVLTVVRLCVSDDLRMEI